MGSDMRTLKNEYKGEPELGHSKGRISYRQVGVGNGKVGISFSVYGRTAINHDFDYVGVTLNHEQIKLLIRDLTDHLAGDVVQDRHSAEEIISEEQAHEINRRGYDL